MGPLFRWAGSKKKLLPYLKNYIPSNISTYYEPFCGSACLYFDVLPRTAVLSDMNSELIFSYKAIRDNPAGVHSSLMRFEISNEEYLRVRALKIEDLDDVERAARFLYLNKLCFNGVYRTNLQGQFNVPMGSKTGAMPSLEILCLYAKKMKQVKFYSGDYHDIAVKAKAQDFIYLDPPYSKPGNRNRGEYGPNSFHYNDIERMMKLLAALDEKGVKFALSYCDCELIRDSVISSWRIEELSVKRHVAGFHAHRKEVSEVIISNQPFGLAFS